MGKNRDRRRHARWEEGQLPRCRHNRAAEHCSTCAAITVWHGERPSGPVIGAAHAAGPVQSQAEIDRYQAMKLSKTDHI